MINESLVTQEVFTNRFNICLECSHLQSETLCDLCGCDMGSKCQVKYAECPINKWSVEV